jgi:hypothetical protein
MKRRHCLKFCLTIQSDSIISFSHGSSQASRTGQVPRNANNFNESNESCQSFRCLLNEFICLMVCSLICCCSDCAAILEIPPRPQSPDRFQASAGKSIRKFVRLLTYILNIVRNHSQVKETERDNIFQTGLFLLAGESFSTLYPSSISLCFRLVEVGESFPSSRLLSFPSFLLSQSRYHDAKTGNQCMYLTRCHNCLNSLTRENRYVDIGNLTYLCI